MFVRAGKQGKLRVAVEWTDDIDKGKVSYMLLSDIFLVEKSLNVSAEEN